MAKITEYRDIPLSDLIIGKGQCRTQDLGKELDLLSESIKAQGLLQPIVVCAARKSGKWEILTGQRRFLAYKSLKKHTISAAVLDKRVEEGEAKAISITENLIRRQLSSKELTDGITFLYNLYGSIKDVVETTGLPSSKVRDYVKYPRLLPALKKMVQEGKVDVHVAVKAQDAATGDDGISDTEAAINLAKEMAPMSGAQRKKIIQERQEHPEKSVDEVIENAKTGGKVVQVVVTLTQDTNAALTQFAKEEGGNKDDAAVVLIEEALVSRGFLEEEE